MSVLRSDYDSDPQRFLSSERYPPREDVHPAVAERFAAVGARTVADVGGGSGKLARLLPSLGMHCVVIDLSPAMLELAPRPAVRADGERLPLASTCVDAVAALYTLYHYEDPRVPIREAKRILRPGGVFAACAPNRDSTPELAAVLPDWGSSSTFDGEEAAAIVQSVFSAAGDRVSEDRWDGFQLQLTTAADATAFLRVHGLSEPTARAAAESLTLPKALTMRGSVVYATKSL